jgi:CelD/BcsL family acetyltransferase involved in cellulose biosynthesis
MPLGMSLGCAAVATRQSPESLARSRPRRPSSRRAATISQRAGGSTSAELVADLAHLRSLAPEWRELAATASNPAADPAWVVAWLEHAARRPVAPRVVAVRDRGRLIGVAPFYVAGESGPIADYALMGGGFGVRMEPLALPGREQEVATQFALALASTSPRPDTITLGPTSKRADWIGLLQERWPARARGLLRHYRLRGEPAIVLREPTFEAWLDTLGAKTRRNLRRERRLFERSGGRVRWSTSAALRKDAEAFARLHRARWQDRGESRLVALAGRLPDWLEALGRERVDRGGFRLCVLEADGAPICADLRLIAGEESAGVNIGWDQRYARVAPGKLAIVEAVRDAYEAGCRRVGLGFGEHPYKLIFANACEPISWSVFIPSSRRIAYTYARVLPLLAREKAREDAERLLPPRWFQALRGARRKLRV